MKTISEQTRLETIAAAVIQREQEVFHYQLNIDNYTAMLAVLPTGDWPVDIAEFKDATTEALVVRAPDNKLQLISDYLYRDKLARLLVTERIEQGKAQRVYDALVSQLPKASADALIQSAATVA